MPSITNVGGSLTSALILTLLAWGVRWVRSQTQQQRQKEGGSSDKPQSYGRFFSRLSPAALCMLVESAPVPYLLVDVRGRDVWEVGGQLLPQELLRALRIEAAEIADALTSPGAWRERLPEGSPGPPHPDTTLVFLTCSSEDEPRALQAAAAAASRGYQRTALLQGGIVGWRADEAAGRLASPHNVEYIERDALALLLGIVAPPPPYGTALSAAAAANGAGGSGGNGNNGHGPLPPLTDAAGYPAAATAEAGGSMDKGPGSTAAGAAAAGGGACARGACAGARPAVAVVDLRRADERAMYGALPGALHLPADQLASALALLPSAFRETYRFDRPVKGSHGSITSSSGGGGGGGGGGGQQYESGGPSVLVLYSRTNRRATWAALLAAEAGLRRCLVYKQGVYGWRGGPRVRAYRQYSPTDVPPEPEDNAPNEPFDPAAGLQQLQELGLDWLLLPPQLSLSHAQQQFQQQQQQQQD